jgi:hypothetical protein
LPLVMGRRRQKVAMLHKEPAFPPPEHFTTLSKKDCVYRHACCISRTSKTEPRRKLRVRITKILKSCEPTNQ